MSIFDPIRKFRQQLDAGQRLIGAGVTFSDPLVTEALAPSVDFLWIDLEHTPLGPEALAGHLLAGRATATPCLVRVAAGTTACIKPVIDSGALGIIVPQIETAEEAYSVVRDCRYPPVGSRGYGPRVPSGFGALWQQRLHAGGQSPPFRCRPSRECRRAGGHRPDRGNPRTRLGGDRAL